MSFFRRWSRDGEWREERDWRQGRERDEAWNTARWVPPAGERTAPVEVRWDPVIKVFFADGVAWPRPEALRRVLAMLEAGGWRAEGRAASELRERLGL